MAQNIGSLFAGARVTVEDWAKIKKEFTIWIAEFKKNVEALNKCIDDKNKAAINHDLVRNLIEQINAKTRDLRQLNLVLISKDERNEVVDQLVELLDDCKRIYLHVLGYITDDSLAALKKRDDVKLNIDDFTSLQQNVADSDSLLATIDASRYSAGSPEMRQLGKLNAQIQNQTSQFRNLKKIAFEREVKSIVNAVDPLAEKVQSALKLNGSERRGAFASIRDQILKIEDRIRKVSDAECTEEEILKVATLNTFLGTCNEELKSNVLSQDPESLSYRR